MTPPIQSVFDGTAALSTLFNRLSHSDLIMLPFTRNGEGMTKPPRENRVHSAPAVFAIPELLEQIFLALPLIDVIVMQRVCKQWNLNITSSVQLQRALFLSPSLDGFLQQPAVLPPPGTEVYFDLSNSSNKTMNMSRVELNPLMSSMEDEQYLPFHVERRETPPKDYHLHGLFHLMVNECKRDSFKYWHEPASWRNLYLTQPPATQCVLGVTSCPCVDWRIKRVVENPKGVTIGDVVNAIEDILDEKWSYRRERRRVWETQATTHSGGPDTLLDMTQYVLMFAYSVETDTY
ncbi:hypothetical protein AOQ84DRAFT_220424 [Glonium stellatum]|uniref:DUF6699 domain-containing protein n=1 Tax=Glonium stellatum TaxID=574774 RepID=A0A8E2F3F4_9PEZI|nr:hypothetical protein AOQ84DRAFT_220424 [Glonium stellatum]